MEATRNLCAQIPISLHDRVREERESLGQSLSEYVTQIPREHFEGGKPIMTATKTLAFQIPEELDLRDIDGIRKWFTASLTGMGNLLDLITESPVLTGGTE